MAIFEEDMRIAALIKKTKNRHANLDKLPTPPMKAVV